MKQIPDSSVDMVLCDLPYATVTYLNDKWQPVPAPDATMVKVTFDDGGVLFGVKK